MKVLQFFEYAPYFNMFLKDLFKTFKTFHDASKMIDLKGIAPNGTDLSTGIRLNFSIRRIELVDRMSNSIIN